MFQKFRVTKSVDSEGRKIITYVKNTFDESRNRISAENLRVERLPEALEMTVRLP